MKARFYKPLPFGSGNAGESIRFQKSGELSGNPLPIGITEDL